MKIQSLDEHSALIGNIYFKDKLFRNFTQVKPSTVLKMLIMLTVKTKI